MITLGTAAQNPIIPASRIATYDAMANAAAGTVARQWWDSQVQPQIDDVALFPKTLVYGGRGLGALIQYRRTNDPKMAQGCANILLESLMGGHGDPNWVRAYFSQSVCTAYEIWKDITPDQQASFSTLIQATCDFCTGRNSTGYGTGFRLSDTDQTVGQYSGITLAGALFHGLIIPDVATPYGGTPIPIGGLDATAADGSTVRNKINQYMTVFAQGGDLYVSSGYNFSDDALLLQSLWLWAFRAKGVDHFPEIKAWIPKWALWLIGNLVPTLKDRFHDGDDQSPDSDIWDLIYSCCMTQQCLVEMGETKIAGWVKFLIDELYALFGNVYPYRWSPQVVAWLDPFAPAVDYRPDFPRMLDASQGIGKVAWHYGMKATDLHVQVMSPNSIVDVDHKEFYLGALWVFDNGQIVLKPVEGYGPAKFADVMNAPLYFGQSVMSKHGIIQPPIDTEDYSLTVCASDGPLNMGWNAEPTFVHEGIRLVFVLPKLKAIVTVERMNLDDPRKWDAKTLAGDASGTGYKALMDAAKGHALKEVLWHCPLPSPTATKTGASWPLADGQSVRADWFSTGGDLTVSVDPAVSVVSDASQVNAVDGMNWSRIRYGSDRAGAECIVSVFQWGANQVAPDKFIAANNFGFAIGNSLILFSYTGAMPTVAAGGGLTDYLIGTDASGKWSVTTQTAAPVVVPPIVVPPVVNPPVVVPPVPVLAAGQPFVGPDGLNYAIELVPTLVRKP